MFAILIEAALLGFLLVCLHSPTGADNPVWFYLALILRLPGSLLFVPLFHVGLDPLRSTAAAVVMTGVIALFQEVFFSVMIRKPWRRT